MNKECVRCGKPEYNTKYYNGKPHCKMCYYDLKNKLKEKEDIINKPSHYHDNGVDPIAIGESILTREEMNGFYKLNMIKYWYRAGKKDNNSKEQDLNKYEFYRKKLEEMN